MSDEIDEAREELDRLLEERNGIVAEALDDGFTQTDIASVLGLSRTAVQKMVKPYRYPLTDSGP